MESSETVVPTSKNTEEKTPKEFYTMEGNIRGQIIAVFNEIIFHLDKSTIVSGVTMKYWRCKEFRRGCKATLKTTDGTLTATRGEHSCNQNSLTTSIQGFKNELKKRAKTEAKPLNTIYDKLANDFALKNSVLFSI